MWLRCGVSVVVNSPTGRGVLFFLKVDLFFLVAKEKSEGQLFEELLVLVWVELVWITLWGAR